MFPLPCPLSPSGFLFLAPEGTLDALVPPGPWGGSKIRVKEETRTRGHSLGVARVQPWANKHFSICREWLGRGREVGTRRETCRGQRLCLQ